MDHPCTLFLRVNSPLLAVRPYIGCNLHIFLAVVSASNAVDQTSEGSVVNLLRYISEVTIAQRSMTHSCPGTPGHLLASRGPSPRSCSFKYSQQIPAKWTV